MFSAGLIQFFSTQQEILWLVTVVLDLSFALLLFRLFGRQGLYAVVIVSLLLANLFGPKLTIIFGMQTSMGVILYSSIYFATDLLSERYGRREANRAVLIGFFVSIFIILMISVGLMYLPSSNPKTAVFAQDVHEATQVLFDFTPRFILGSLLAYLISQNFDVWMFHYLKQKTNGKHLWLRNNVSTLCSQAIDTLIYGLVVWWGIVELEVAIGLALVKYFFKVLIALLDTPFIYWARTWDVSNKDFVGQDEFAKR